MNKNFTCEEIYPNIVVYKNLFKDIDKVYDILKKSTNDQTDRIFSNWTQWSIFGDYLNPVIENFNPAERHGNVDLVVTQGQIQQDQKDFLIELFEYFHIITEDYTKKHNIPVDYSEFSVDNDGNNTPTWRVAGPTICKYHISDEIEKHGMRYHSDYQREQANEPGYKFAITALAYFNDDYVGGEIDFVIGKKMFKYKPKAGDYIVFPSGHPDILTENGNVYIHGVMPSEGTHKYFSRMYIQQYYKGSDEWLENQEKYGVEKWASMQEEIREEFRKNNPQRSEIEGGIRIQ